MLEMTQSLDSAAKELKISAIQLERHVAEIGKKLLAARQKRIAPQRLKRAAFVVLTYRHRLLRMQRRVDALPLLCDDPRERRCTSRGESRCNERGKNHPPLLLLRRFVVIESRAA